MSKDNFWGNEKIIMIHRSIIEADIYKVCRGKKKTIGGYLWKYNEVKLNA